jgi:ABC-2 type transport system ATP-binding protein
VILDEPWSGLDPINAEVLRDVVDEIRAEGRTVLFSTHQMEQAEKVCDAVCIIARGKKIREGRLRDIKRAFAAEGLVALDFTDDAARTKAHTLLADPALVSELRPPGPGEHADCEVKLADGVVPARLLAALVEAGIGVRLFELVVPSLHQIFVHEVGATAAVAARIDEDRAS